jgi:hypothetical protein
MMMRRLIVLMLVLSRASSSENDGDFDDDDDSYDDGDFDFSALTEYVNCLGKAGDDLQPKIDAMESACQDIGLYEESSETRISVPVPTFGRSAHGGDGGLDIPSLDLDLLEGANVPLFVAFCYEKPRCKNAYQDLLRAAVKMAVDCAKKLPGGADSDLSEMDNVADFIDELCPILTHRLVAKFILSGSLEDYDTAEAKAKIIAAVASAAGLAVTPLATVSLKPGSVIAEVTIPLSSEEQAKAAKAQLEASDLNSVVAEAGLPDAIVQDNSVKVDVEEENNRLSAGAIAGIVVGAVVGVVLLLALAYFILRSKSKDGDKKAEPTDSSPAVVTGIPVKAVV